MRILLDENQSPSLAELLAAAGHDAIHVRDLGLASASDAAILAAAVDGGRVLISGDSDFGELLARSNASAPSVLLFRRQGLRRAHEIAALLLMNLPTIEEDLARGAVVVFDDDRLRIRSLPLNP